MNEMTENTKDADNKGRRSALTPASRKKIVEGIEYGMSNVDVCKLVGIHERTFYAWIEKGERDPKGKYYNFCKSVEKARVKFKEANLKTVVKAAWDKQIVEKHTYKTTPDGSRHTEYVREEKGPDWKASAWLLERHFPEEYARKLEHRGEIKGPAPNISINFTDNPGAVVGPAVVVDDQDGEATAVHDD